MDRPAATATGYAAHAANGPNESLASGVSWAAVIGGAFVAAALSLILLALGAGLGLSSVSPWSNAGASATTMTVATAVWLICVQIFVNGTGGYVAGRLRTKWVNVHTDEVFFRDTAHGLLVWAVGLVVSAGVLGSAATSMVGGALQAGAAGVAMGGAAAAGGAATAAVARSDGRTADPNAYFVDSLFRSDKPVGAENDASGRAEVERILAKGLGQGNLPPADRTYIASRIAARTGIAQPEAEKRVDDTVAQIKKAEADAREAADKARKAAAYALLWIFVSLLIGAFSGSYAATIGGRQRDGLAA